MHNKERWYVVKTYAGKEFFHEEMAIHPYAVDIIKSFLDMSRIYRFDVYSVSTGATIVNASAGEALEFLRDDKNNDYFSM